MGGFGVMGERTMVRHASEPPEARGVGRDQVRLMVSHGAETIEHLRFADLAQTLRRGDLLVVNTSATLKASVPARRSFGAPLEVHLSSLLPGGLWSVEVRESTPRGSTPLRVALAGEVLALPEGGRAALLAPYPFETELSAPSRLWAAALELPVDVWAYLSAYGSPIRYGYVKDEWPIEYYQTVFAREPGSAEMPSAGRPFTDELVHELRRQGVRFAPLVLHTGVASLEEHEPPYEERYRVPLRTASAINDTRRANGRVIAVGTTVVRALETVTDEIGVAHPGAGWTDVIVDERHHVRAVDGLLTGLHEPKASHLHLIQAVVRRWCGEPSLIDRAYEQAIARKYLWHEFGDAHLILPPGRYPTE